MSLRPRAYCLFSSASQGVGLDHVTHKPKQGLVPGGPSPEGLVLGILALAPDQASS